MGGGEKGRLDTCLRKIMTRKRLYFWYSDYIQMQGPYPSFGMCLKDAGRHFHLNPSYHSCAQGSALMLLFGLFIFHLRMQLIIFTVLMLLASAV